LSLLHAAAATGLMKLRYVSGCM